MRNLWTICRKELGSYFVSPVAYVLLTFFSLIVGYMFALFLNRYIVVGLEMQMQGQMTPMNLNEELIRPLLGNLSVFSLFFIPLITMRLFAEEKRTGTIELLVTSPVRDLEIILGKWLAALILYSSLLLFTALNFGFLFRYGNPDWKPLLVNYLGLLLQAGAFLSIGIFISTLTKNQIVAGAVTFAVILLLWMLSWLNDVEATATTRVLAYMSVVTHYESFARGVIDSKDAVFYLTVIFLGLFFTARSMESLRWRS